MDEFVWIWKNFLKNGFNLSNDSKDIKLLKGNVNFTFNKVVRIKNGLFLGLNFISFG
jgi:hypothetical protein